MSSARGSMLGDVVSLQIVLQTHSRPLLHLNAFQELTVACMASGCLELCAARPDTLKDVVHSYDM